MSPQAQRGFSLLEVLVACSLSVLAIISIYDLQSYTIRLLGNNQVTQSERDEKFSQYELHTVNNSS